MGDEQFYIRLYADGILMSVAEPKGSLAKNKMNMLELTAGNIGLQGNVWKET